MNKGKPDKVSEFTGEVWYRKDTEFPFLARLYNKVRGEDYWVSEKDSFRELFGLCSTPEEFSELVRGEDPHALALLAFQVVKSSDHDYGTFEVLLPTAQDKVEALFFQTGLQAEF